MFVEVKAPGMQRWPRQWDTSSDTQILGWVCKAHKINYTYRILQSCSVIPHNSVVAVVIAQWQFAASCRYFLKKKCGSAAQVIGRLVPSWQQCAAQELCHVELCQAGRWSMLYQSRGSLSEEQLSLIPG